jgi:thioredoxin
MKFHPIAFASIFALLMFAGCGGKGANSSPEGNTKAAAKDSTPGDTKGAKPKTAKAEPKKAEPKKAEPKEEPEPEEDTVASKESVVKVKRLLRRWYSEVRIEREEAWEGLKDMGDLATPALIEVVKSGKPKLKRFAITAIGLLKDKLGAEAIRGALSDKDSAVRWSAARAAGEIGDAEAKPILARLVKDDKDSEVRYYAAYSLAGMNGAEAFTYFKAQMKSSKTEDRTRALRALGKYGKGKYTAELVAALKDKEDRVRYSAVIQLDRSRRKEGIPGLISALDDDHRDVRKRARSALERLTGQDFGRDKPKWEKWWKANAKKFKVAAVGPRPPEPIKFANAPAITGAADFKKKVTDARGFVLVDFFHPRGKNCRKFAPVFDKLAKEYKGKVAMYNCPAGKATIPIIKKLGVRVPPTTVVFKDGKKLEVLAGAKSEAELKKAVDEHLAGKREIKAPVKTQKFPDVKDAADFKKLVTEAKGVVLVDFHADWCGWCKRLKPILNKLVGEYRGKVAFVGVDTEKNKALKTEHGVKGLPTMIIFKDGKQVEKVVGFRKEAALKAILEKHLVKGKGGDK